MYYVTLYCFGLRSFYAMKKEENWTIVFFYSRGTANTFCASQRFDLYWRGSSYRPIKKNLYDICILKSWEKVQHIVKRVMPQTLTLFIARIQFNSLQMQPQSFLSDRKILLLSPWIEYLNPVEKLVELYSTGKNPIICIKIVKSSKYRHKLLVTVFYNKISWMEENRMESWWNCCPFSMLIIGIQQG